MSTRSAPLSPFNGAGSDRMKRSLLVLLTLLFAVFPALCAEQAQEPLRVVPTPTGCAVSFDKVPDDFRVDRLVDGGVTLTLFHTKLPAVEKDVDGGCIAHYRISSSYEGQGTTIERKPVGQEVRRSHREGQTRR